ncbi:MAG: hypothetical protein WCP87_01465 [Atribacterota bacterium]
MTALEVLGLLQKRKIDIWLVGSDLKIAGDEEALTDDLVLALRTRKKELVSYFSQRSRADDLSAEWRQYARWSWTGILLEAERVGDTERVDFARGVLATVGNGEDDGH